MIFNGRNRLPGVLILMMLLGSLCGCSAFYRHKLDTPAGTLWTNVDLQLARSYQHDLVWMRDGLQQTLPRISAEVGPASILLGNHSPDHIVREDEVRTAGWYNHAFSIIRLTPPWESLLDPNHFNSEPNGQRTLLHELAHHFTEGDPRIRSNWWLSEAIACSLEVAHIDPHGQFQVPPVHPGYYREARTALSELGRNRFLNLATELLSSNWINYYRKDEEVTRRYAVSWAIFWTLFHQQEGTYEPRLEEVLQLDSEQIIDQIPAVIDALTPSLSSQLREYFSDPRFCCWSVDQSLRGSRPAVREILPIIEKELERDENCRWAWACATRLIHRSRLRIDRASRDSWRERISEQLASGSTETQLAICHAFPEYFSAGSLTPGLIDLLESADGSVRHAAATVLARSSRHPTVLNPSFWQKGIESDRAREVAGWRSWYQDQLD